MKQADECKRAGVPKALKIVEGNIYVIKSFYKHLIHDYELFLFIKTIYWLYWTMTQKNLKNLKLDFKMVSVKQDMQPNKFLTLKYLKTNFTY